MNQNDWSELLDSLREWHAVAPDYRFGQLICNVANLVGESEIVFAWDAGDEDLVVAARRFSELHRRLEVGSHSIHSWPRP